LLRRDYRWPAPWSSDDFVSRPDHMFSDHSRLAGPC
jgi:hypothetical protein